LRRRHRGGMEGGGDRLSQSRVLIASVTVSESDSELSALTGGELIDLITGLSAQLLSSSQCPWELARLPGQAEPVEQELKAASEPQHQQNYWVRY